ncbi:hypothetical protein ASPACDRAFT_1857178 [Aspergillus aculeatus ATCC 16872]|uniref:AA9 family lytic polysaccharide monooxygenase n=1 Tax=Aspergillus aculeatus (strain ATCC 16872 / CBS 172.66 / WB 5094) TaxID=690307 RepID=A0A1L9WR56_ASPA1|nr:uncharacterized protein ASPACDRAFT_1857178 [Aspergillus aculeatus ATCC 16872]OJJ98681.1 hypothetical protein ASPACDRAFT_1857178 [Aspergillus aculeatus ATCC 16872]
MKYLAIFAAAAAGLARPTAAHYIFSKLILDGEVSEDWQYIRKTTRETCYLPTKFTDTFDNLTPNDQDFRCNLGSFSNAAKTEVAEVEAGSTIGMQLFAGSHMRHPGPAQVFMSKAPSGNVQSYEGDGSWFKIWERTLCDKSGDLTGDAWCTYGQTEIEFQIPEATPTGEYLVRAEHIGLHRAQSNQAEFYYSCAQVKVTGNGTGVPSQTYQIPGMYNDRSELFNGLNLWSYSVENVEAAMKNSIVGDEIWNGSSVPSESHVPKYKKSHACRVY